MVQRVVNHQRDELLGELVRPVVVGAAGDDAGETVGVVPGAHEEVGRGLGGAVGAMRRERRVLAEEVGVLGVGRRAVGVQRLGDG